MANLPAVTPVQTDLEMLVIQQVASEVCPVNNPGGEPNLIVSGAVYSFSCPVAAGHTILAILNNQGIFHA